MRRRRQEGSGERRDERVYIETTEIEDVGERWERGPREGRDERRRRRNCVEEGRERVGRGLLAV
eukprot:scaffold200468_cov30-Tisochrysis_lutea.AAC.1